MVRTESAAPSGDFEGGTGFFNRLNRKLFPYLGPPPLGPYDQPEPPARERSGCPLCGKPMAEHHIDRSGGADRPTKFYCP